LFFFTLFLIFFIKHFFFESGQWTNTKIGGCMTLTQRNWGKITARSVEGLWREGHL